jgi:hypothetical protein
MSVSLRGRRDEAVRLAGLAAVTVPLAVGIHVVVELVAAPRESFLVFALRHAYMLPLAIAATIAFAAAAGLTGPDAARRRALARAALLRRGAASGVRDLCAANLGFFIVTQLIEGVPIAAGSLLLGAALAAFASLVAAFVVVALRRSFVAFVVALRLRARAVARPLRRRIVPRSRVASYAFSLFVPNRPPPECARPRFSFAHS